MLFTPGGEGAPPAPPPPRTEAVGYRIRRPSGRVFGPFTEQAIVEMLGKGELNGNEDVSAGDGEEWIAIGAAAPFEESVKRMNEAPLVAEPPPSSGKGVVAAPFQPRMQGGFREKVAAAAPVSRKRMVVVGAIAGAVLLVAAVGTAGAFTRHGPFFWKAFRSGSDPAVAKLAAEGRQLLGQDALASDQKALQLAQQGLAIRADDPEGARLLASAAAALSARGVDGQAARARQLAAALAAENPDSVAAQEARLAVALATGENPAQAAAALEKVLPAQPEPESLALLARAALARGELARASSFLDRLDAASPGIGPRGAAARRRRRPEGRRQGGPRHPRGRRRQGPGQRCGGAGPGRGAREGRRPRRGAGPPGAPREGSPRTPRARGAGPGAHPARRRAGQARRSRGRRGRARAGRPGLGRRHRGARGARTRAPAPRRARQGRRRARGHARRRQDGGGVRAALRGPSSPPGSRPRRRARSMRPWPDRRRTPTCSS